VPTLETLNADYESLGADISIVAHLGGVQHCADNTRVLGLLELWLCQTDWWTYSRCFEPTSNGRGVWLALVVQNEGTAATAIKARELEAHMDQTTAYHSGGNQQSTWDNHIRVSYSNSFVAAQQRVMAAIVRSGMKSRRATLSSVVSFVGTEHDAYFGSSCKHKRKRGCSERENSKSKKQKGSNDGGLGGQKPVKPKSAERGVPETALQAGDNALDAYDSMSQAQPKAALVFCKTWKKYKNGSDGRAMVVESQKRTPGTGWPPRSMKMKVLTSQAPRRMPRLSPTTRALQRMMWTASLPWGEQYWRAFLLVAPRRTSQRGRECRK
jgi:hypothetical protein